MLLKTVLIKFLCGIGGSGEINSILNKAKELFFGLIPARLFLTVAVSFLILSSAGAAENQDKQSQVSGLDSLISLGQDPRISRKVPLGEKPQVITAPVIREIPVPTEPRKVKLQSGRVAVVNPNIQMHPSSTTTQSEMSITTHPLNPNITLAGANAVHTSVSVGSQGWYYTTDGGTSWSGSDTLPTHSNLGLFMADPAVGIDLDGNLFFNALRFGGNFGDVIIARSTNNGVNWAQTTVPSPSISEDKNHLTVDVNPGGPFENYLYTAYTDFAPFPSPVMFSRSTNQGVSFTSPVSISGSVGSQFAQGINLAVGPNGELYATWSGYDSWPPPVVTRLGFNKSTDGGATWGTAVSLDSVKDIRGELDKGGNFVRVNSFPSMAVDRSGGSRDGWIYIVYPEKNPTTPDIFLIRSTDGGGSWSTPIKVNQDNSGKDQWFAWITVDPTTGVLYVVYYDSRNFSANDSAQVYISSSLDGGVTFESDVLVSDVPFLPTPIPGLAPGYMGDYIGISALNGVVWPCWNDDRTGIHQAYTSRIVFIEVESPPKISVFPDTLDFGGVFLGYPETLSIAVRNLGFPDSLFITNIQSDTVDFTPALTSFGLAGGGSKNVKIACNPSDTGLITGTLTITSSDTANPTVTVALQGMGLIPPDISVSPDSLSADLFTGGMTLETLTIFNTGFSDLNFSIGPEKSALVGLTNIAELKNPVTDIESKTLLIDPLFKAQRDNQRLENVMKPAPVIEVSGLAQYLVWDPDLNLSTGEVIKSILLGKGFTVDYTSDISTISNFNNYLAVFITLGVFPNNHVLLESEVAGLVSYLKSGGNIYMEGNDTWAFDLQTSLHPYFNILGVDDGTSDLFNVNGVSGTFTEGLSYSYSGDTLFIDRLAPISPAFTILVNPSPSYNCGVANEDQALSSFQSYRTIGTSFSLGGLDDGASTKDELVTEIINFFGAGPLTWLILNPNSGTVPAGDSMDIEVTFDAFGLIGGDYYANLLVFSNDPDEPQDTTPVHLHVTGARDIEVSKETLDYHIFIGGSVTETLVVSNEGTDSLTISNILSDNPNYTVDTTNFSLNPEEKQNVLVTFTPPDTGLYIGNLTISSNDPDESSLIVSLQGLVLLPPDISVTPESLSKVLVSGMMVTETLTISNSGFSDLIFDFSIERVEAIVASLSVNPQRGWKEKVLKISLEEAITSTIARSGILNGPIVIDLKDKADVGSNNQSGAIVYTEPEQIAQTKYNYASPLALPTVAILGSPTNPSWNNEVQSKVLATGLFSSVSVINISVVTPTLAELQTFDAVLVYSDGPGYQNSTLLGNVLADYVDGGGGVVVAVFATASLPFGGRFNLENYWAIAPSAQTQGTRHFLGTIYDPSHLILKGVASFDGGSQSYRQSSLNIATGATRIADWTDGRALVATKVINGTSRVDLGFFPPSSDARGDFWEATTDGDLLMANALKWVAGGVGWLFANPTSGTVPASTTLDIAVTFDATGLDSGNYKANMVVSNNDPDESQVIIPVTAKFIKCIPGDVNNDESATLPDIIFLVNYVFKGGPKTGCRGDINASLKIDLGDIIYLVNYIFKDGPNPISSPGCCP